LPAARGDSTLLERLIDFTLARDYPHLAGNTEQRRGAWFIEVCERTARLVAHWLRVGFVHGVMNTDNLSILGLTIDYGPYGWLEDFDVDWTPNTTDAEGRRYCYGRQPQVAHWNLARLAGALAPLFDDQAPLHEGLQRYVDAFHRHHATMNAAKLGLAEWRPDGDDGLARDLYRLLGEIEADLTLFFRQLAAVDADAPSPAPLAGAFYDPGKRDRHDAALRAWLDRWAARVREDGEPWSTRRARMDAANPLYVPRNWLAQEAIEAATAGDLAPLHALVEVLQRPYEAQPGREHYAARRPDWARNVPGCSMLSCSS
jgi:uncharacterized protein YdiU (UPF0061 family)